VGVFAVGYPDKKLRPVRVRCMNPQTRIALALSAFALVFCVACPVLLGVVYTLLQEILYPASLDAPIVASVESSEAEYYRGVFDVCVYFYVNTGGDDAEAVTECNGFADRVQESSWYLVESKGYEP